MARLAREDRVILIEGRLDSLEVASPLSSESTIDSGIVDLGAGASANVTFAVSFLSAPKVVVTPNFNSNDASCQYYVHSVTASGFTLRGAGNPAGNVAWIAVP